MQSGRLNPRLEEAKIKGAESLASLPLRLSQLTFHIAGGNHNEAELIADRMMEDLQTVQLDQRIRRILTEKKEGE